MRYGLSTPISIAIYKLGFADRVIVQDLEEVLDDIPPLKNEIVSAIHDKQVLLKKVIEQYPSYYQDLFEKILFESDNEEPIPF